MLPKLIDTHAHLDSDIYSRDLDVVIRQALDDGVWTVTVGSDYASSRLAVEIAERYPVGVYAAVGLHPKNIRGDDLAEDKLLDLEKIRALANHPKVVALGETGLDYHDLPTEPREDPERFHVAERVRVNQKKVFGRFLQLSQELRLPILLHCRDAHDDCLEMIENWDKSSRGFDCRGIVHHFSGDWKQARRYFGLDFLISFTGLVVHGGYLTQILKKTPENRYVLESDCPHLTTAPWASRRNEPSYLQTLAGAVAGARGETLEKVMTQSTANALAVLNRLRP